MHVKREALILQIRFIKNAFKGAFWAISGDQSGKIVIWNMAPVRDEEKEKDENVPKMLCQMDNHLGEFNILTVQLFKTGGIQ